MKKYAEYLSDYPSYLEIPSSHILLIKRWFWLASKIHSFCQGFLLNVLHWRPSFLEFYWFRFLLALLDDAKFKQCVRENKLRRAKLEQLYDIRGLGKEEYFVIVIKELFLFLHKYRHYGYSVRQFKWIPTYVFHGKQESYPRTFYQIFLPHKSLMMCTILSNSFSRGTQKKERMLTELPFLKVLSLTLAMLNKLRCHSHF